MKLLLLSFIFISTCFGQPAILNSDSLLVSLNWKTGDTHSVKIVSNTSDNLSTGSRFSSTKYLAKYKVLSQNKDGFLIKWQYTKFSLDPNEINVENIILCTLLNVEFDISISLNGVTRKFINVDEVRIIANKVIDSLITLNNINPRKKTQFQIAKTILSTNQGVENGLLKHIDFYTIFFGSTYSLKNTETRKVAMQDLFADEPRDAIETTTVSQPDNENNTCQIERKITTDGNLLKQNIIEFLQKKLLKIPPKIIEQVNSNDLEYSVTYQQKINFNQSFILNSKFIRKMNLGYSNRTIIVEIENAD